MKKTRENSAIERESQSFLKSLYRFDPCYPH
nr:MAG TPA: hypothetical protein [Caudoviricetes sp.]